MTRTGLACWACACALVLLGCGDDDAPSGTDAKDDGGETNSKPIVLPGGRDAGKEEDTATLGDAGMRLVDCDGADDGSACGPNGGLLCLDGSCLPSRCGDGFVDPALEECDDENAESGDGCGPSCNWDCTDDAMCDDGAACNGEERCLINHTCSLGTPAGDGTACTSATAGDGQCRQGTCTPAGCGDEEVKGSEQCDDGNDTPSDGCEIDCSYSCEADVDCDDGTICSGQESCDVPNHTCIAGSELRCADESECTADSCDADLGCQFAAIDADGDGHSPDTLSCGDDCDDSRPDVHPGHPELCDDIDHDCIPDTGTDEVPSWYEDCDDDGYAAVDARAVQSCDMPAASSGCKSWTTRKPVRDDKLSYDCNDAELDAYPGQGGWFTATAEGTTSWEYNCNTTIDLLYPNVAVPRDSLCKSGLGTLCSGKAGWTGAASPKCGGKAEYTRCSYVFGRVPSIGGTCQRTFFEEQQQCR
ncbi:MAG TPA: putative metal-binding motif-containing protein [Polyangiales bacterium]|nr:putative metal-binding motif-containing protein [Polyangiales bacterium]